MKSKTSFRPESPWRARSVEERRLELIRRLKETCAKLEPLVADIDLTVLGENLAEQNSIWRDAAEWDNDDAQFRKQRQWSEALCRIAEALDSALRESKKLPSIEDIAVSRLVVAQKKE